jgi:hypothetical protein
MCATFLTCLDLGSVMALEFPTTTAEGVVRCIKRRDKKGQKAASQPSKTLKKLSIEENPRQTRAQNTKAD